MTTITFDTYEYVRELKEAGFTEEQAKVQVKAMTKALNDFSASQKENLATKADVADIRREISETKAELIKWMVGMAIAQISIIAAIFATIVRLLK